MIKSLSAFLDYLTHHRKLVCEFIDKALSDLSLRKQLVLDIRSLEREKDVHDLDKTLPGLIEPFVIRYGLKNRLIDFNDVSDSDFRQIKRALILHVTRNDHHLEHFSTDDVKTTFKFDKNQVDIVAKKPIKLTSIPDTSIVKTCCDWCAVSTTLQASPIKYFKSVLGKRYSIDSRTTTKFLEVLERLWG